jgi:hypothetical protein
VTFLPCFFGSISYFA